MSKDLRSSNVNDLDSVGGATATDLVPVERNGRDIRLTAQQIADLGGGGGAVSSVDGRTGAVTLSDLYDAAGSAATAQSNAIAASQPVDADLTAIAALVTTAFGRGLLTLADAAALVAAGGLDADLATFALPANTTISTFGASLVDDANAAAALTTLGAAPLASPTFTGTVTSGGNVIANASLAVNTTTVPTTAADTISAFHVVGASVHIANVNELAFIGTGINVASTIDLRRVGATSYANFVAGTWSAVASGVDLGGMHIGGTTPTLLLDVASFHCVADATFADGSPADSDHASTPTAWEFHTTPASTSGRTQLLAFRLGSDQSAAVSKKLNVFTVAPATQTAAYDMMDVANATAFTNNAAALTTMGVNLAPVITYSTGVGGGNIAWRGFYDQSTHQSSVASGLTGTFNSFHASPTFKASGNTNPETVGTVNVFRSEPALVAGGATGTITVTSLVQFGAAGMTVPTNGTVTTLTQFSAGGPVATGTITTRKGMNIADGSGAGTFTTNIGIDIAALAAGATNIGLRSAAPMVWTPQTITLANGANNNISVSSSVVIVDGPTGAFNITGFTNGGATPVDGQILILLNPITAGAMTITHDATSTAANRIFTNTGADVVHTAGGGSTAMFVYTTTENRWRLTAQTI